ncbi:MAG: alpha-galactosidase [Acholeplasmatales bacterium]|nr:alpha-galactosidase [Acholeplasmatales bacterium]
MVNLTYILDGKKINIDKTDNNVSIEIIKEANREKIIVKALNDIILDNASNSLDVQFSDDSKFFLNGYQSWTDTKECYLSEYERIARRAKRFFKRFKKKDTFNKTTDLLLNRFAFDRYGDVLSYDYDKNKLHGYDVFYIKGKKEFFSFNYNFQNVYLVYEVLRKEKIINLVSDIKKLHLKKGEEFVIFDYSIFDNYNDGLNSFYELFPLKNTEKVFGYTSWYNYYQNINESIILRDLEGLDKRFNLFQIDDGYETFVGDWLDIDKNKFPNGLESIVKKIHEKGYKAGIWLAPFVAEEKSQLFKNHKELFKRDKKGNLIKAGGNWSGFYLLDLENKDTKAYIEKCLKYFIDLGFDFFKLDFLYAVTLPRYYHLTKAQVTNNAYKFIKDVLKDKLILGCGAIPSTSSQYFDYLRVGPDVSLKFDDVWFMRFAHRERISTKVTIQNTIYRSIFDKHLFLNDPDVFLLRSDNISLNDKQKEALLTINALFGSVLMTSDNIASYDEKSKVLLEKAFELFYTAKVINYERENDYIHIEYKINDNVYKITYNTMKGELINGR